MKRIMTYTAVVLATLLVLAGLWQFRLVLLLFVLSLFMAATIRPFVNWLTARGLSKSWAQLLLYAIGIGSIILIFLLIGDLILIELNSVANLLIIEYEGLYRHWQTGPAWQQMVVSLLPEAFAAQDADLQQMLPVVVNVTRSVSGVVGGLLLLLALSTYWSADQHRFERLWLSLLPAQGRAYARDSWRQIETAVGSYLLSQTAQSILAGSALSLGAALIGLSYPFLLGFIGALAAFVPLFGGLVTAIVAFGLGSLESYGLGVAAAVFDAGLCHKISLVAAGTARLLAYNFSERSAGRSVWPVGLDYCATPCSCPGSACLADVSGIDRSPKYHVSAG